MPQSAVLYFYKDNVYMHAQNEIPLSFCINQAYLMLEIRKYVVCICQKKKRHDIYYELQFCRDKQ